MEFMRTERDCLEQYLPGLDKQLRAAPLTDLEQPGNAGLRWFREAGGPALLIPAEYGGGGAEPAAAVRIQRAIATRSPSLAVATTMHHFSVASLVELMPHGSGFEWALLQAISEKHWLVSSAFAEGRPGQHILQPTMRAERVDGGLRISGVKKPCSLTWSMDLLSASVAVTEEDGSQRLAVVLVPASTDGIERRPFWGNRVLAGAESDAVELRDVHVPDDLVFVPQQGPAMDSVQARGFVWFELLIAGSYLGVASALVERALSGGRGSASERLVLVAELESAMAGLEQAAAPLAEPANGDTGGELARALCMRYAAERTIERVAMAAAGLTGGMAFIGSDDVAYLLAASRALAFHPPSLTSAAESVVRHLGGAPLSF